MIRWRTAGTLMLSVTLVVTGCGTPRRTITGSEAIKRIDDYLGEAVKAAPSGIHVEQTKAEATYEGGCVKGLSDSDFTGQVEAEVEYEAKDVPPDTGTQYVEALNQLWKKKWGTVDRSQDGVRVSADGGRFRLVGL